ncbi:MAG: hypothetical protein JWR59_468 [Brevundimonas sp.]|nr:hypothetical protein [Brevundimonas sp.]
MTTSPIIGFLNGTGRDAAGRTLEAVLALDDAALERNHDFVQWLFPLPEPSRAVPGSPVLTEQDRVTISGSAAALANLAAAAERMSAFYATTNHWLGSHDHNHLRISRIIRSLRLLVGDSAADHFRDARLTDVSVRQGRVNPVSLEHWRRS